MKLIVSTPTEIAVNESDVPHVRAEDATGAFGIERGHAEFLTALAVSVVTWRDVGGAEHYVAVRGGVLRVRGGHSVEIATREAVVSSDLDQLRSRVLSAMRKNAEAEQSAKSEVLKLEHAAIRRIYGYLRPSEKPVKANPQN